MKCADSHYYHFTLVIPSGSSVWGITPAHERHHRYPEDLQILPVSAARWAKLIAQATRASVLAARNPDSKPPHVPARTAGSAVRCLLCVSTGAKISGSEGGNNLDSPPASAQGKSVPPGAPCSFPSALTLRSCLGAPCQYALGTGVGKVRGVRGTGILLTQELRQLLMALPRRQQKAIPRPAELMDSSRDRYPLNENKVIKYCRCN